MIAIPKSRKLMFTRHARAKMQFYKLSESRVRHVLHSPKRIEEGIAPKTVAMMQPVSVKNSRLGRQGEKKQKEIWSQEIWIMIQDAPGTRKIISAWRYPGMTKTRSVITHDILRQEYSDYLKK